MTSKVKAVEFGNEWTKFCMGSFDRSHETCFGHVNDDNAEMINNTNCTDPKLLLMHFLQDKKVFYSLLLSFNRSRTLALRITQLENKRAINQRKLTYDLDLDYLSAPTKSNFSLELVSIGFRAMRDVRLFFQWDLAGTTSYGARQQDPNFLFFFTSVVYPLRGFKISFPSVRMILAHMFTLTVSIGF